MLRGVFGRSFKGWHIPDEVLEEIFKFGFHLWLAIPCDVESKFENEDEEGSALMDIRTTRMCVLHQSLTTDAWRSVNYIRYWGTLKVQMYYMPTPARPAIFDNSDCHYRAVRTYDFTGNPEHRNTTEWALAWQGWYD